MKIFFVLSLIILNASGILFAQNSVPDNWMTKFERSAYLETSRYDETIDFYKNLEKSSPFAKLIAIGASPQGRTIYCLIASKDKAFTPVAARAKNIPVMIVINGIHSGEIEGKDASMLLLREILITKEKAGMLDSVTLLVIPVFSVDAHERWGKYNRINQNGPIEMGWRTTANNLNLNRDWLKCDTPEMQALIKLIAAWDPDYAIDTHTTDGADFQYTATYGLEKFQNLDDGLAALVRNDLIPHLEKRMLDHSYYIAPYFGLIGDELKKGILDYPGIPRLSTGYFAARNRICLLVETHMLKPYKDRVFATKAMIEASVEFVRANALKVMHLNKKADEACMKTYFSDRQPYPIQLQTNFTHSVPFFFRGITYRTDSSYISGAMKVEYTGNQFEDTIPFFNSVDITDSITLPYCYVIPREWSIVAERMRMHGVNIVESTQDQRALATRYKFRDVKFASSPYEGRQSVTCNYDTFEDSVTIAAGSYIVYPDQRALRLIVHSLEPKSPDSFLRWGFMNAIFEQKEYFEEYVMEKVALEMIQNNPQLKQEFEDRLTGDPEFAKSPRRRLQFFYERSPYIDSRQNLYPIFRIEKSIKLL